MSQAPLGALRVLEAVARHGSFSRAADELCVTQSAVSHQVRGLEDWLGAPLFERSGNRATLRPHGAELAAALSRALGEIDAACRRARRAGGPPSLTVAVIPSVAICWLIPRLGGFRALLPDVTVRIVYAIHGQPVDFRDADLAVVFAERPLDPPGMAVARFLPGRTVPVAAPHLGRPETPAAMLAAGLLHDTDLSGWRGWLDAAGAAALPVAPGPVFEDFNLLRAAALAGQGVALCPLAIIADDLREGRLGQLSEIAVRDTCGYYLLSSPAPAADRAPAVAAFRDWLLATAGEPPSLAPGDSSRGCA
ncbi:MAG: LysR substrate-binding domain-containing protein [Amaricoccus sp.]|uniref:LysR substrate-binding domain-containing protein n=1 Tax=Amaricoccus sp. TaxID=1872485 RepID=UPI0039E6E64B